MVGPESWIRVRRRPCDVDLLARWCARSSRRRCGMSVRRGLVGQPSRWLPVSRRATVGARRRDVRSAPRWMAGRRVRAGRPWARTLLMVPSPHWVMTADMCGNTASCGTNVSRCTLVGVSNDSWARAGPRVTTARIGNPAIASRTLRITGAWPCGSVLRLTSTHGCSPSAGGSQRAEPSDSTIVPT